LLVLLVVGCRAPDVGFGVALRLDADASVSKATLAGITTLDLRVRGDELAQQTYPVTNPFSHDREERVVYRPKVTSGHLQFQVTGRGGDNLPLAYGEGTVDLRAGGTVALTVKLTPATPRLTTDLSAFDFGLASTAGPGATRTFTVSNDGNMPTGVVATSLDGADGFHIDSDQCGGQTLAPGASCTVAVRFSPTTEGSPAASLQLTADPGGTVTIQLTGRAVAPGDLTFSPAAPMFNSVPQGESSAVVDVTLTNHGATTSGALDTRLDGTDAPAFSPLVTDGCKSMQLAPGASCVIQVRFNPSTSGKLSASLAAIGMPGGTAVAELSGTAVSPATLAATPVMLTFSDTVQGQTSPELAVAIKNNGQSASGALAVSLTGLNHDAFALGSTDGCSGTSLGPGDSCTVTVVFQPAALPAPAGDKSATLTVVGATGGSIMVPLGGRSVQPGAVMFLAGTTTFPVTDVSQQSTPLMLTLKNTGAAETGTLTTSLTADKDSFTVLSDGCTATSLSGGQTCVLSIAFKPTAYGVKTLGVSVSFAGGSAPVTLSGIGRDHVTLTITFSGSGSGTVSGNKVVNCTSAQPCTASYARADAVNTEGDILTALSNATGSYFMGWKGDCTGRNCSLKFDAPKSVTAMFARPVDDFGACMTQADWDSSGMGNLASQQTTTAGPCTQCHTSGGGNAYLSANSADTFSHNKLQPYLLALVRGVTDAGGNFVDVVQSNGFRNASGVNQHPTYNLSSDRSAAIDSFYMLTHARWQSGSCP
jgi:hypothetical protein